MHSQGNFVPIAQCHDLTEYHYSVGQFTQFAVWYIKCHPFINIHFELSRSSHNNNIYSMCTYMLIVHPLKFTSVPISVLFAGFDSAWV